MNAAELKECMSMFEQLSEEHGYGKPPRGPWSSDAYMYGRDQDRYNGFELAWNTRAKQAEQQKFQQNITNIITAQAERSDAEAVPVAWMDPNGSRVIIAKVKLDTSMAYRSATQSYTVPLYTHPPRAYVNKDTAMLDWLDKIIASGERIEFAPSMFGKGVEIGLRPRRLGAFARMNIRECIGAAMAGEVEL